jgi:hypothetical protein
MSQVPPIFKCDTCHRLLVVKICKSDKNGNAGRAFTNCYKKHANDTRCDFFAWVDPTLSPPSSRFPSSSPVSSPSFSAPPSAQPMASSSTQNLSNAPHTAELTCSERPTGAPSATQNLNAPQTTEPTCSKPGKVRCNTTRLHPACTRQMCRRHCIEAGGCQGTKTHMARSTATLAGNQRAAISPFNPPSPSSSPPLPTSTATASTSSAIDLFADPRYASQMTAAFTQQYADKYALEEQQRVVDAERLANIEKAKNHVIIYAWPKVSSFLFMLDF